jgi:hypothetical protein
MKLTKTQLRKMITEEIAQSLTEQEHPIDLGGGVVLRSIPQHGRNLIDKEGKEIDNISYARIYGPILKDTLPALNNAMGREVEFEDIIPIKIHNGLAYFTIGSSHNKYVVIGVAGPGHTRR